MIISEFEENQLELDLIGIKIVLIGSHSIMILPHLTNKELKIKILQLECHLEQLENLHFYMLKMAQKFIFPKRMVWSLASEEMLISNGNML